MNLLDSVVTALLSFGAGVLGGVFLEKHRRKEATYQAVLRDYLATMEKPGIDSDSYLRMGALQRSGGWLLTNKELRRLTNEIIGRGYQDPDGVWAPAFDCSPDFPKCALEWAKRKNVDFTKPDEVLRAMAADWDASKAPKPPSGPSVLFVDGF